MAQWITFFIFGGMGLWLLYVGATQWWLQNRLLSGAQPVSVEITRSEVETSVSADTDSRMLSSNSTTSHRPGLRFRYSLAGREHESDMLHPTVILQGYASRAAVEEVLRPYPLGARVQAHVNPRYPDRAFLIARAFVGPQVFTLIGLLLPPLAWFIGGLI